MTTIRRMFPASLLAGLLLAAAGCKGSHKHSIAAQGPTPPPGPPSLNRGPFLAETTTDSVVIVWRTDSAGVGTVEYGPAGGSTTLAFEPSPATDHEVRLAGLAEGADHVYLISTAGIVHGPWRMFRTARPAADLQLRFVAFGDSGAGTPAQLQVRDRIIDSAPDLAILTGDIIYESGQPEGFDPLYFVPYRDLIDHVPFFPCLGNHDVITAGGDPYFQAFHLPHNNPEGTERYYSFEAANARFIALDSNGSFAPGTAQHDWLAAELLRPADWKFVYFHYPPFSSAMHTSDLRVRAEIEDLLLAGGVDMVFNGHDHVYERSYPLASSTPVNRSQEPNYSSPAGVIYVVTGGGGQSLYARTQVNDFTAVFESVHHLVQVDLAGRSLTLTAVRADGTILDRMTIQK